MGIARGPNIMRDNLVAGYDTGYGVANNNTATRFYPGQPVVNLFGDTSNANARPNRTEYNTSDWTADFPKPPEDVGRVYSHTSGSLNSTWSGNSYGYTLISYSYLANTTYTLSCWVYVSSDCNITAMHQSMEGTTLTNTTNRHYDLNNKGTWQQLSISCNSSSVVNGNAIIAYPSRSGVTDGSHTGFWVVGGAKLETNTHVTPYILGTRSDTASLIDLKRTTSINVSNMSFDTTGQPDMDGSGDYVDLGSDVEISSVANAASNGWTAEYVFNSDSASTLQHFNGCEEDVHNAGWLALYQSYLQVWDRGSHVWKKGSTVFASNTWYHIAFVQVNGTTMQFYVNGVAEGGDHVGFAWTAAKSAFFARYIGRYEYGSYSRYFNGHIPVARLYDKALTASEIKVNFDAFKNRFNI